MSNYILRIIALLTVVLSTAQGTYAKGFAQLCTEHGGVTTIYQNIVPNLVVDYSDYTDFYVNDDVFRLPNLINNSYIRDQISKSISQNIPISICYNTSTNPYNTVIGVSMDIK